MSGSRADIGQGRGSSTGQFLDQVLQRTGSPAALLDSVVAETQTRELGDRVRQLWASPEGRAVAMAAQRLAPRLTGGPYGQVVLLSMDLVKAAYPELGPDLLAWAGSEAAKQWRQDGRHGRRPAFRTFGGWNLPPGWSEYLVCTRVGPVWSMTTFPACGEAFTLEGIEADLQLADYLAQGLPLRSFPVGSRTLAGQWSERREAPGGGYLNEVGRMMEWLGPNRPGTPADMPTLTAGVSRETPSGYPDLHKRKALAELLGHLPFGFAGGTRNIQGWRARRLELAKERVGFAEVVEPKPVVYWRDRSAPADSLQVWPNLGAGPPHQYRRPNPRRVREMKVRMYPLSMALGAIANAATETGDFVEVLWKSIPKEFQKAKRTKSFNRRIDSMLADIWRSGLAIDWEAFKAHYEANQMEDLYYGVTSQLATAAGLATRRGAGGFGMGHALGLHGQFTSEWGSGSRADDPVSFHRVDPVKRGIDAYERWALESRARYVAGR